MNIVITPDPLAYAAGVIADEMRRQETPVLGLATGRTMEKLYRLLVDEYRKGTLDFSTTTSFNLDEYVGLAASNPNSYRYYMQEHLFGQVNMRPDHVHVPDGMAQDLEAECARYEQDIRAAGGIGLQLLGIGETGHIGFNEPPSAFDTRTRPIHLDAVTRRQNAAMFGNDPSRVPEQALTMGVGTILEARHLLMVALGSKKAAIVRDALEGPLSEDVSASALQTHPHCTIVLDEAAASLLSPERRQNPAKRGVDR